MLEARIRNDGPEEHRFTLEVVGESAQWVSISPFALTLGPGQEGEARVFVRPPRSPDVSAGHHEISVQIRADRDPRTQTVASATVDVEPFHELSAALDPVTPDGRRSAFALTVDNRGNAPLRVALRADSQGRDLKVAIVPADVEAAPGGRGEARVSAEVRRAVLGRRRDGQLRIVVDPSDGAPVTLETSIRAGRAPKRAVLAIGAVVAAVALIAAVLNATVFASSGGPPRPVASGTGTNCPSGAHLAHDANGAIRAKVLEPDNYAFLFTTTGGCLPVRWNPCEPIHYVFNQQFARPADLADARQAIDTVAQATGIQFVFDGTTTQDPRTYESYQPAVFGRRWAPVMISWGHLGGGNGFTEVAGGGFPEPVDGVYVSGIVGVNVDARLPGGAPVPNGFGSGVTFGRILLHELGHVMGLGHVTSFDEVMHDPVTDQTSPTSAYGFGDVVGLRLLGRQAGCLATPAPRALPNRGLSPADSGTPTEPAHGLPTTSVVSGG